MSQTELVPSISIAHLLQQRDAIMERVTQAHAMLDEAHDIATQCGFGAIKDVMQQMTYHRDHILSSGALERIAATIDASAWQHLMANTALRSFMDKKARQQWDEQIDQRKTPPLTEENIKSTFGFLYEERGTMFERGVIESFRRLSWDYKTNLPSRFGKRLIITYLFTNHGHGFMTLNSRATDELDDLLRAFCILDGQPERDHRQASWREVYDAHQKGEWRHTGPYYEMKWFKNGNCHLKFNRMDLVERMNEILAKHYPGALPEARPQ